MAVADLVVLDLEDAVAPARKQSAREALATHLVDPERVIVRVNGALTVEHDVDLEVLRRTPYRRLMLPKATRPEHVEALADWEVVALCETALGVLNAPALAAAAPTIALMWGAEDLVASLGGRSSRRPEGGYSDVARHARSAVLLAAAAHDRIGIDAVFLDATDLEGLRMEAEDAAAVGFGLKACIHPRQVPVVRRAFVPSEDQFAWARRVVDAASGSGVILVDGHMIDAPLLRQAERILSFGQ
jgi:citrate lyase subunit beta / citryl-CoA lyase